MHLSKKQLTLIGLGVVAGGVVASQAVLAQSTLPDHAQLNPTLVDKLYAFISTIVLVILQTVANLTALSTHVIVIVSQYNQFIDVPVVQTGWAIVRDVTNMFFIVALLVIAAGTILRIENYRYNRLLARLIIMAFLVNFSRLIAGFFIQTSQVVMLTFVNAYKDAMFGNFAEMFGLTDVLRFAGSGNSLDSFASGLDSVGNLATILMSLLAGLAMMVVALIVTISIAIILLIRIIALWVLVILSPLAFALRILPNTERFASKWWSEFGKYVTLGPVLAFILWLSLAVVISTGPSTGGTTIGEVAQQYQNDTGLEQVSPFNSQILKLENFIKFLIGIIFLIMGLQYASSSATAASGFARSAMGNATNAALGVSGITELRNRTIEPVRGWLSSRSKRGQQAVDRRAAAVDLAETKVTGAASRAAGAVGAGVKATARGIGQVVTRKKTVEEATEGIEQAVQGRYALGTPDSQAAAGQVADARRQKREAVQKSLAPENMSPADRRAAALQGDKDERMVMIAAMAANRELDVNVDDERLRAENKQLAEDLGKDIMARSASGAELSKEIEKFDPEVVETMFAQYGQAGMHDDKHRLKLASIGRYDEAFGQATEEAKAYLERNSRRVKEQVKKGLISSSSVSNRILNEKIHSIKGLKSDDVVEGLKNNRQLAQAHTEMAAKEAERLNADGDYADSKGMKLMRESQLAFHKGGKVEVKDENGKVDEAKSYNIMEKMYVSGAKETGQAIDELGKVIRTKGKELGKFEYEKIGEEDSDSLKKVKTAFRDNVTAGALPHINEDNPTLSKQVIDDWGKFHNDPSLSKNVRKSMKSKIRRVQRNDVLAGLAAHIDLGDDDNSDGEGRASSGGPAAPPPAPPGASRAEREAAAARPAREGGKIVTPPGANFEDEVGSREERGHEE